MKMVKGRVLAILAAAAATGAVAQTVRDEGQAPAAGLDIPQNLQIFGKADPNVRKPTAIVNDVVVTGTDVDQRLALIEAANDLKVSAAERDQLRLQILRQLIDETLQIGAAKDQDITITKAEIDQSYNRVAGQFQRTPAQMASYLRSRGSSEASLRRQIEGELAWQRVLRRRVEPFVNVSDEEVNAILARLKASQGAEEFHLKEIFLSATPEQSDQVYANAKKILDEIQKQTRPFEFFASNFSEATTRAVQGDLGWIRAAQLPTTLGEAATQMRVGQIVGPIDVGGGYSILWLVDKRQVLTADPRDARLDLRQLTVDFPAGTTQAQASARATEFATAVKQINGCGDVNKIAATLGAKVVTSDQNRVRDLPAQLQEILLQLQVGQATPPFGSPDTGVRALVLCGRDDPQGGTLPDAERLKAGLEGERVNRVAQRMLRDLRRDAVVEYK